MLKQSVRLVLALAMTLTGFVALPSADAHAASVKCNVIRSNTVGGYDWTRLRTKRVCQNNLRQGVAGSAQLKARTVTVRYSERRTSVRQVQMATVHELSHEVEYWTTDAKRAKLYSYLGIKNHPSYFGFNDAYHYSGSLTAWRQSPRERLAESVVHCTYGSTNHSGLVLVPKTQCKAFLKDFRSALSVTR